MDIIIPALIGLGGVFLGILLNEYFRRSRRIEEYSLKLFDKRLSVYEGLFKVLGQAYETVQPVLNGTLDQEERHTIVSQAVLLIAGYTDENQLYLKDEVTLQCCTAFMSAEDIGDLKDEVKKEAEISRILKNYRDAKKMIRKECGLTDMDKLLTSMMKIKHDSPVIRYFKKLKGNQG